MRYLLLSLFLLSISFADMDNTNKEKMQKMLSQLEMLDKLDKMDFEDIVYKAKECIIRRNISCAKKEIRKSKKFLHVIGAKNQIKLLELDLENELAQIKKEKEAEERLKLAIKEERERQEELRREAEMAQRRREERESEAEMNRNIMNAFVEASNDITNTMAQVDQGINNAIASSNRIVAQQKIEELKRERDTLRRQQQQQLYFQEQKERELQTLKREQEQERQRRLHLLKQQYSNQTQENIQNYQKPTKREHSVPAYPLTVKESLAFVWSWNSHGKTFYKGDGKIQKTSLGDDTPEEVLDLVGCDYYRDKVPFNNGKYKGYIYFCNEPIEDKLDRNIAQIYNVPSNITNQRKVYKCTKNWSLAHSKRSWEEKKYCIEQ